MNGARLSKESESDVTFRNTSPRIAHVDIHLHGPLPIRELAHNSLSEVEPL